MKQHDNDNDEFSFVSIAAATANALRYLRLDAKEDDKPTDDGDDRQKREKDALERLEFVKRRLRDLGRFEDRARGQRRK